MGFIDSSFLSLLVLEQFMPIPCLFGGCTVIGGKILCLLSIGFSSKAYGFRIGTHVASFLVWVKNSTHDGLQYTTYR
jgi:hypothetical protein